MAHFYGTLQGTGDKAVTRTGTKRTGMRVTASGYRVGVEVELRNYDNVGVETDMLHVTLDQGSGGSGNRQAGFAYTHDRAGVAQIRFARVEFFQLFSEEAWRILFEHPDFMEMVKHRLLANIDKVQQA